MGHSTEHRATTIGRRRGRPRGGSPVAGRDDVVAAAIRAIQADGPDVTMDDVAAAAAVSKPIVYRLVGDKAALRAALSAWLIDRIDRATAAARDGVGEPRAQFRAALQAYFATIEADRDVFLFVNGGGHSAGQLGALVDRSAHRMIELFEGARRAVGLEPAGARSWAYAIVGSMQMVMTMWAHDPYCDRDALADDLTRLMWDGLAGSLGAGDGS